MRRVLLLLALSLGALRAEVSATEKLFMRGVTDGDLNTIENLLSAGFDPTQPVRGHTTLYHAIQLNQVAVLRLLLDRHVDPNAPVMDAAAANFNTTPLQLAVQLNNLQIMRILLRAGAEINGKGTTGRSALQYAVRDVRLDAMRLLLNSGADVNLRDVEGGSPLDDAVWNNSLDATALLLARGARLNEPNTHTGATPVNEAAFRGNDKVIQYLLHFHPDLTTADKRGYRPVENAIRMGKDEAAVVLLEAEPKELQTPDFLLKAMGTAAAKDEAGLVAVLLRRGVSANGPLTSGITPLDAAAQGGAAKAVKVLLEDGADPDLMGSNGATPLEDASLKGFEAVVSLLLDRGAAVNGLNRASGTTALYAAASFGRTGVAKILLTRGANASLCGTNRKTPFEAAMDNNHEEIAALIESHGGARSCRQ